MNKDKRGEISVGALIGVAIGVIVCLILFQAFSVNTEQVTTSDYVYNSSRVGTGYGAFTTPAAGACKDLIGQELIDTPMVTNGSSSYVVPAANYTISEGVSTVDNLKRIRYCSTAVSTYAGLPANITYIYAPEGYIDNAGARSVVGIIGLLAAIAVIIFALLPVIRSKLD
jgi:hypothetical protein